jgi:precorrin-6Y C5,15-methyltransferase (decarboxylating)
MKFEDPNVVILKRAEPSGEPPHPLHMGMAEEAFDRDGDLITKPEIRAVSLAKLSLLPHHTLWDLGAGSGSVAIESTLFLTEGRIIAVEQKPERVEQIRNNIKRFGLVNIRVVRKVLPEGLEDLPAPDRVFIGGGGRSLGRIITSAAAALRPSGIMVINAVLLDNIQTTMKTLRKLGFSTEAIQVQVQRSRAMPFSDRFEARNPVWIITGKKES